MSAIQDTIDAHLVDTNNPHHITKTDVGLALVNNYTIATTAEAFDGVLAERFVTPLRLKDVFRGLLTRRRMLNAQGYAILQ